MGWMSWEVFRCQTNCTAAPHACINAELYTEMSTALAKEGYLEAGYRTVSIECAPPVGLRCRHVCPSLTLPGGCCPAATAGRPTIRAATPRVSWSRTLSAFPRE